MSVWLAVEVAWVPNGVLVGVVKGDVEYGELEILRVGCVLDFLAATENQLFVVNLPVFHRDCADGACPSPLDDTDARNVDITEVLEYRQGGAYQGQVDHGVRT